MPSLGDSVFIFMLALMLLGPKKLPQLARQLGKLMAEFRKASNEFRMQMEDELRIEDQKEHQKKVDALAPPPSAIPDPTIPTEDPTHPHLPAPAAETVTPIAESGDLKMMPPATGLPVESSARGMESQARRSPFASSDTGATTNGHTPQPSTIPEHSIANDTIAHHASPPETTIGMSSDEPFAPTDAQIFGVPDATTSDKERASTHA